MTRPPCIVAGCDNQNFGQGYCNMHYKRWRKTGDAGPAKTLKRTDCSVPGCPEPHCALGFCNTHWARFKATGVTPGTPIRRLGAPKEQCVRLMCERDADSRGYCTKHYNRLRLLRSYEAGFSYEDYDRLFVEQGGKCKICQHDMVWDSKLTHVDHCHEGTGIRGLLCSMCNQGLGSFRDNPTYLAAAIEYLKEASSACSPVLSVAIGTTPSAVVTTSNADGA